MSQDLTENNKIWLDRNNEKVTIDNRKYIIKVTTWKAIYPSERSVISIQAEMINKNSKYYQDIRNQLKDDWSIDILDSSIELQCDIESQFN